MLSSIIYGETRMRVVRKGLWRFGFLALLSVFLFKKREELFSIAAVVLYAGAFSVLLSPLCMRIERKGVAASAAAGMAIACLAMTMILLISVLMPFLFSAAADLMQNVIQTVATLIDRVQSLPGAVWMLQSQSSGEAIAAAAAGLTTVLTKGSKALATQAGRMGFALVLAYYFLCERRRICLHLLLCVPFEKRSRILSVLSGCKNAVLCYLSGMLKTSAFISAATFLGLLFLGIENAALLALVMGLLEFLPYIGPFMASIPILLSSLSQGIEKMLMALALIVVIQQIESSFVSPYFTASSTSIHPLTAVLGVYVLGTLAGIWGVILAVPLVVIAKNVMWTIWQHRSIRST